MGLLDRLFLRDPVALLEKGEQELAAGDALKALHIAQDLLKVASPSLQGRARDLGTKAREALMTNALEKALRARNDQFPTEEAGWLETALDHCREDSQRQHIEELLTALRQQVEGFEKGGFDDEDLVLEDQGCGDEEHNGDEDRTAYEMLLEFLTEDVAPLYEDRTDEFREAYVALNTDQAAHALLLLDALVAQDPGDPVLRLERGRSHLLQGHFEEAVADLELAWPEFRDEPLDWSGDISVPLLWSEAKMALGRPDAVVSRLESLADPTTNQPRASSLYADALMADGQLDKALRFLSRAAESYGHLGFRFQIGDCLVRLGEVERAIAVFEGIIAPFRRSPWEGSTDEGAGVTLLRRALGKDQVLDEASEERGFERAGLLRPVARILIALYLEGDRDLKRAEQIAEVLERDLRTGFGREGFSREDLETLSSFYQRTGDTERVAKIAGALEQIGEKTTPASPQAPSVLRTATKAL